jgi:general secretion pathway protein L
MTINELLARSGRYAGTLRVRAGRMAFALRDALVFNVLEGVVIPKKCLCAALEKGRVSVAYGTRFLGRPGIKGLRRYPFDEGQYPRPEDLSSAISEAVDDFGARGAAVVLSIPRRWVLARVVELPAVVRENLASVIAYELDRLTPFSPAEAMYDFTVSSEENGKLRIAIVVMRAQTARPYLDALGETGVTLEAITTDLTAFGTLCSILGDGQGTALCTSVDEEGYEACLMRDGAFVSGTSEDFTSRDRVNNAALVRRGLAPMLEGLEREGTPPLVILSRPREYEGLDEEMGAPVRVIDREDVKRVLKADVEGGIAGPLGGLVEAIWPGVKGFNLASKGFEAPGKNPVTRFTYALLGLIAVAMVLGLILPVEMEKARLDRIEYQIKARRPEIRSIEALRQEISAIDADLSRIREFKESTPMSLEVMKELTSILPKSVWLTRLRITGETVEMEGYAGSATEILPKLEQSALFKKVEFSSPTIRDTRLNADRFVIKMEIEGYEKKKKGGAGDEKKK